MRLIDADALIESANEFEAYGYVSAFEISLAPTVDAVQVVRCKDCRYFLGSDAECALIVTRLHFYEKDKRWTEESYCSWGERRNDGNS